MSMSAKIDDRPMRPAASGKDASVGKGVPLLVAVFIIGLVIPLFINIGPIRLTFYRIVLLLMFFPGLYYLLSGRVGRLRLPDFCVVGICIWSSLSFIVIHGLGPMVETIGIFWVETLGAYLVGRIYIRTPDAFHATVRMLFWLGILILPFAIYEAVTGRNMITELFGKVGASYANPQMEQRLGFDRVQGPFPHPIHFGVFFLSLVGVVYYVLGYGRRWAGRAGRSLAIAFVGAFSLSSGPLVSLMAQANVLLWDGLMKSVRQRWHILAGLSATGFVVVDIISNRTPFHVVATYLAFSTQTAYSRIWIWQWGTKNIFDNPVFGIGLNDWERGLYMVDSVDMFWILPAMRHGIPVWIMWLTLFFSIFLAVAYRRNLTERVNWYRTGYLVSMFGFFMVGWTVHFWTNTYAFFLFLLASGVWILDWQGGDEVTTDKPGDPEPLDRGGIRYTRFPPSTPGADGIQGERREVNGAGSGGADGSPEAAPMSSRGRAAPRARL